MEQIVKVRSNEVDGDESGRHWFVHYVLFKTEDEDGTTAYALFTDDGHGNGVEICAGPNRKDMLSLTLRLGEWVEWTDPIKAQ